MKPMRTVCILLCVAGVARAQKRGSEDTPAQCRDHIDNDRNGLVDCDDPKCGNLPQCRLSLIDPLDQPLTGKGQMTAGIMMLIFGPALAGASSAVYLDAEGQNASSKRTLEFTMGGVLTAAGAALAITGAALLKKGWSRYKEDVEMGIAWNRLDFRVRF
jgi:hypothetical protein